MGHEHDRATARLAGAGRGWWNVAIIVGLVSAIGGAIIGYAMSIECFGSGALTSCRPGGGVILYVLAGAAIGVIPALPMLAIAQLYGHLAALEHARTSAASARADSER